MRSHLDIQKEFDREYVSCLNNYEDVVYELKEFRLRISNIFQKLHNKYSLTPFGFNTMANSNKAIQLDLDEEFAKLGIRIDIGFDEVFERFSKEYNSFLKQAQVLFDKHANPQLVSKRGNSFLHLSLMSRWLDLSFELDDTIELASKYKINFNLVNHDGSTALYFFFEAINNDIKYIKLMGDEVRPHHYAAKQLMELVRAGADITTQDAEGNTLLHYVMRSDDSELLDELVEMNKSISGKIVVDQVSKLTCLFDSNSLWSKLVENKSAESGEHEDYDKTLRK